MSKLPFFERTLFSYDMSNWLLGVIGSSVVNALSLRAAGGFYFVPADRIEVWRSIRKVVQAVGSSTMHEIPAMRTDDALDAILESLKLEAQSKLGQMADYLKGDVSTKGLNATERDAAHVRQKLQNYIDTLGVALPELTEWCEQIHGAVQAAHMIRAAEKAIE